MSKAKEHGIEKLSDYSHIRKRTEMYLSSRSPHTQDIIIYENGKPILKEMEWVPALYTSFREALDNAVDEVVGHGHGTRIDINYDEENTIISVQDDGRGIPIDYDEIHKDYIASMVVSNARAGRNFGERGEVAGTNGIGISAVCMVSEWFEVEVLRDNKKFVQRFQENPLPGGQNLKKGKPKITDLKSTKTGTKISFKLSDQVFNYLTLPIEFVKSRVYEIAVGNPLIRIYFNGERIKVSPYVEKTLWPNQKPIIVDIEEDKLKTKFYILPEFSEKGETVHSIVNNIPAFDGGIHVDTFKRYFYSGLISALEREAKRRKISPNRSDISEGLLVYNITHMTAPDFNSQSKTRLINEWVGKSMKKPLEDPELYKNIIRKNKEWVEQIFERAAQRTNRKEELETNKAAKQARRSKVKELRDATGKDRKKCILFIMEGESAVGGLSSVRTPEIHGALPLTGKILNVNGEPNKKVISNAALLDIMNALGIMVGEKANRSFMRYGKLYIATDADPDGANISALLINFFYTYWPELFDPKQDPFIHLFMTPFIIAEKGKQRKYWYSFNVNEFKPEDYKGWEITRAKGLAALLEDHWKDSLDKPVAFPITDDGNLKESLDLIFNGSRADDRKAWMGI